MNETKIGDVIVSSADQALDTRHFHSDAPRMRLNRDGNKELMDFFKSCTINELNQRKSFRIPFFPSSGLSARLRIF